MAQPESPPSRHRSRVRESAERVLVALPQGQRAKAVRPFDDSDRIRLALHTEEPQRHLVEGARCARPRCRACAAEDRPVGGGLSQGREHHRARARAAQMETFGLMRDPERYHITFYGTPSRTERWGWRFEGHHLSLNFTLAGDRLSRRHAELLRRQPGDGAEAGRRRASARWARSMTRDGECWTRCPRRNAARR